MTTFFAKSLGPYSFADQIATVEEELTFREQTATIAGRGGRFAGDSLFDGLILTVSGLVLATDIAGGDPNNPGDTRTAWDRLKGALIRAGSLPLFIDSDRYANVRLGGSVKASAWGGLPSRDHAFILVSREDPPWWGNSTTTQGPYGGAGAVTTAGNGPADPTFSLTVTASGGSLELYDGAGQACFLSPDATGTYLIDTFHETVTLGGMDKMFCFDGDFVRLLPGANALTLTPSGGAAATWSVAWQDRWY